MKFEAKKIKIETSPNDPKIGIGMTIAIVAAYVIMNINWSDSLNWLISTFSN